MMDVGRQLWWLDAPSLRSDEAREVVASQHTWHEAYGYARIVPDHERRVTYRSTLLCVVKGCCCRCSGRPVMGHSGEGRLL